jgi:hypothetical protein
MVFCYLMLSFSLWLVSKVSIVEEKKLLGVRIIHLTDDDMDGGSCGTAEYTLVSTINYALRNNKTRPILTETENSGLIP